MFSVKTAFYRWFLDLVLDWLLSRQFSGNVRVDEETVLAVLPHGQLTQRGAGAYFTSKQANKLPRRGEKLNIITVGGIDYIGALGDTRKRSPALRPMGRGGGAFLQPLPPQPAELPPNPLYTRRHTVRDVSEAFLTVAAPQELITPRYRLERFYHHNGVPRFETMSPVAEVSHPLTWAERNLLASPLVYEEAYATFAYSPANWFQLGWPVNVWDRVVANLTFTAPTPILEGAWTLRDYAAAKNASFSIEVEVEPMFYQAFGAPPDSAAISAAINNLSSYKEDQPPGGTRYTMVGSPGERFTVGPLTQSETSESYTWPFIGPLFSTPLRLPYTRPESRWDLFSAFMTEREATFAAPPANTYALFGPSFVEDLETLRPAPTRDLVTTFPPFVSDTVYLDGIVEVGQSLRFRSGSGTELLWVMEVVNDDGILRVTFDRAITWTRQMRAATPLIFRSNGSGTYEYKIVERVSVRGWGTWLPRTRIQGNRYRLELSPGADLARESRFLLMRRLVGQSAYELYCADLYGEYGWQGAEGAELEAILGAHERWLFGASEYRLVAQMGETLYLDAGTMTGRVPVTFKQQPADQSAGLYLFDYLDFETPIDDATIETRDPYTGRHDEQTPYYWGLEGADTGVYHPGGDYDELYSRESYSLAAIAPRLREVGFSTTAYDEVLSEAAIAEIDVGRPYIYQDFEGNKLPNPFGSPKEASFYGVQFTAGWYVADVFLQDVPESAEGELMLLRRQFAVAILDEPGYPVLIARDGEFLGAWPLFDFFPPAPEGKLRFLDGSPWPPEGTVALKPHYTFLAFDYDPETFQPRPLPQMRDGYLAPFTARLRTQADKGNRTPPACPLSLFLDSFDEDGSL